MVKGPEGGAPQVTPLNGSRVSRSFGRVWLRVCAVGVRLVGGTRRGGIWICDLTEGNGRGWFVVVGWEKVASPSSGKGFGSSRVGR